MLYQKTLKWLPLPMSILALGACAKAVAPITLETDQRGIQITAMVDTVTIRTIKTNRGNCAIVDNKRLTLDKDGEPLRDKAGKVILVPLLPDTIKFGQKMISVTSCSQLLEVEVGTDQGVWVFTMNQ